MPTDFDIFWALRLHDVWMWDVYQKLFLRIETNKFFSSIVADPILILL